MITTMYNGSLSRTNDHVPLPPPLAHSPTRTSQYKYEY